MKQVQKTLILGLALASGVFLASCSQTEQAVKSTPLTATPALQVSGVAADFAYPAEAPSVKRGLEVYNRVCKSEKIPLCQIQTFDALKKSTPVEMYMALTASNDKLAGGQPFREALSREERWALVFYLRSAAGEGTVSRPDMLAIFGANCAVCHGKKGFGDGPLYINQKGGKPRAFYPAPVNFHQASLIYNQTDEQLHEYIAHGLYPSAMPHWLGNKDKQNNFVWDDAMIWDMVRYIRQFGYNNDLETASK